MDLLLESLKSVYNEIDEEQQWLDRIEEILLRPDAIKEAPEDLTNLDDPASVEQPPEDLEDPLPETPPETPENIEEPVSATPQDIQDPVQAPAPELPDLTGSFGIPKERPKEPQPDTQPAPEPATKPATPTDTTPDTVPVDNTPLTPTDGSSSVDVEKKNRVASRLKDIKRRGKAFKTPLDSEALNYMVYNPRTENLKVTFTKNGRSYNYKNVSMDKAATLIASDHKGTFFNRDIKQTSPATEI